MSHGDDGWLWLLSPDLDEPAGDLAPTELPCPSWCAEAPGHGFEMLPSGHPEQQPGLLRVHRRRFGPKPTHVALETYERAASPAGPSDLGLDLTAPLVRLQFPHACGYLTPAGARRLAELLRRAADAADAAPATETAP